MQSFDFPVKYLTKEKISVTTKSWFCILHLTATIHADASFHEDTNVVSVLVVNKFGQNEHHQVNVRCGVEASEAKQRWKVFYYPCTND